MIKQLTTLLALSQHGEIFIVDTHIAKLAFEIESKTMEPIPNKPYFMVQDGLGGDNPYGYLYPDFAQVVEVYFDDRVSGCLFLDDKGDEHSLDVYKGRPLTPDDLKAVFQQGT